MIIDAISHLKDYVCLNPLFNDVVDFINKTNLAEQQYGIVKIKGDEVYANFTTANGKTKDNAKVETHDRMIDIQIPIDNSETMGYIPREKLAESEYNAEKDITFYSVKPESFVTVNDGEFAIFFPQDGHAPCISDQKLIKKVIFKVKAI